MNWERWGETIVGAIVVVVAGVFFAFAASHAGSTGPGGYELKARFQNVGSIAVGSDVRVSGVKVGVVREIRLDPQTYMAELTLTVADGVQIGADSTARIATDGLLGGAFIAIEPTGFDVLAPGSEIPNTQPAVDFLTLLASFTQNQGQSGAPNEASAP
ncbi:MAG: outer membrane lipid asymmetry maintenance protein MlaD [Hyphomonadaceae bacterium]|nr:outer membrane lipid asymmetry maintenance protein MlaD [Hyphomonadaceae bacterium]